MEPSIWYLFEGNFFFPPDFLGDFFIHLNCTLLHILYIVQKFKGIWLNECDRNTKFFQNMVNVHRRRNFWSRLKLMGSRSLRRMRWRKEWLWPFTICGLIEGGLRPVINAMSFKVLDRQEMKGLEVPFLNERHRERWELCQEKGKETNRPRPLSMQNYTMMPKLENLNPQEKVKTTDPDPHQWKTISLCHNSRTQI